MPYSKNIFKIYSKEILLIVLMIAVSLPTILWMSDRWFEESSYYSHGILVPFVTFFLIWRKRDVLKKMQPETSPWGFSLFILGIFLYWISALIHVYFTSGFSMLIVTIGLVLHFYGSKILKEILFPLLFLVFMIPLPLIVVAFICFKLKIIAAHIATFILNMIGLQATQESSLIKMQHSYVLVEDSCGGLRSLVSLTALGSIFAYQLRSGLVRKLVLLVSAIPIATISNACRIVFLSAVGEIWGSQYTQGVLHEFSGYMVFAVAFLFLFAVKKLLEKGL
jgi:exosortase